MIHRRDAEALRINKITETIIGSAIGIGL